MLGVFSVLLSAINFYFLVKLLSNKPSHQKELDDFKSHVERLMVEFNRITTRNVELLDSRIEELDHKIRLSQKTESQLKDLFEDAHKRGIVLTTEISSPEEIPLELKEETILENLSSINTVENSTENNPHLEEAILADDITSSTSHSDYFIDNPVPSFSEILSIESENHKNSKAKKESKVLEIVEETTNETESLETTKTTNKEQISDSLFEGVPIKKIKKHRKKNSQDSLLEHIQQNKSKDELLELGFNINEINLALLCHQSEEI